MAFDIQSIFLPSVGVDIVFDINSLDPYARSSIIYDTDFKKNTITLAQPLTPLNDKIKFRELHLSTVIQRKSKKLRIGLTCKKFQIIQNYSLANDKIVEAVQVEYEPSAKEINIRAAFRLYLGSNFNVKGKLIHQKMEYLTPRDFSIRDISAAGIGIIIPKRRKDIPNTLSSIRRNQEIPMGLSLVNMKQDKPVGSLLIKAKLIRINTDYSESNILAGLRIITLKPDDEIILNRFIHDAQVEELKRLSGRTS